MKAASDALITLLATSRQIVMVDSYTFTLQGGSTLRYRGGERPPRAGASGDGLLCHFDQMEGTYALSAVGPNMSLDAGASLSTSGQKFGSGWGDGTFVASGVTGTNDTSWRGGGFF
jgi:hypothetical protein